MTQRTTHHLSFDARSLLLVATLTLGGTGALQAQTAAAPPKATSPFSIGPSAGPSAGPSTGTAAAPSAGAQAGPSAGPAQSAPVAFDRADTNQDGQLSEREAVRLPAIHQRFKTLDTDSNGSLSRSEFEKGSQS